MKPANQRRYKSTQVKVHWDETDKSTQVRFNRDKADKSNKGDQDIILDMKG